MTSASTASYPPTKERSSEILYGVEKAVGRGVYFMSNVRERMDIFFDKNAPSIVVDIAEYKNGYEDIRKRGGKIRAFTEITEDNLNYCKQLIDLVDELRHIDGVRGGVAVSEHEYMATTVLQEGSPLTQVIYSNVREVVEQSLENSGASRMNQQRSYLVYLDLEIYNMYRIILVKITRIW